MTLPMSSIFVVDVDKRIRLCMHYPPCIGEASGTSLAAMMRCMKDICWVVYSSQARISMRSFVPSTPCSYLFSTRQALL